MRTVRTTTIATFALSSFQRFLVFFIDIILGDDVNVDVVAAAAAAAAGFEDDLPIKSCGRFIVTEMLRSAYLQIIQPAFMI